MPAPDEASTDAGCPFAHELEHARLAALRTLHHILERAVQATRGHLDNEPAAERTAWREARAAAIAILRIKLPTRAAQPITTPVPTPAPAENHAPAATLATTEPRAHPAHDQPEPPFSPTPHTNHPLHALPPNTHTSPPERLLARAGLAHPSTTPDPIPRLAI